MAVGGKNEHAEIRMISYLLETGKLNLGNRKDEIGEERKGRKYIGIAKLCCEKCVKFIADVNKCESLRDLVQIRGYHTVAAGSANWGVPSYLSDNYWGESYLAKGKIWIASTGPNIREKKKNNNSIEKKPYLDKFTEPAMENRNDLEEFYTSLRNIYNQETNFSQEKRDDMYPSPSPSPASTPHSQEQYEEITKKEAAEFFALGEDTSSSFYSYATMLPLLGMWSESNKVHKIFLGKLPNEEKFTGFHKENIAGDGNCGIIGLGTTREYLVKVLLRLTADHDSRKSLHDEIHQAFMTHEVDPPTEQWEELLQQRNRIQEEWDNYIRQLREEIPEARRFEGDEQRELIRWLEANTYTELAAKLTEQDLALFRADEALRCYCCEEASYKHYVNSFLSETRKLWIGHASVLLFAREERITVYIWEKDENIAKNGRNITCLKLKSRNIAENAHNTIHLYYTKRATHFDILVEHEKPADENREGYTPVM